MYLYADILLLVNTAMNSLILLLTAWAAGAGYKAWRLLAAAFAGALYALGGAVAADTLFYTPPAQLAAAALLVRLAFGPRPWRALLLATACYYLVAFLVGGAVLGWLLLAAPGGPAWPTVTWRHLAAGSALALLLALLVGRSLLAGLRRRPHLIPVTIAHGGSHVRLTALLDTGNSLYTPGGRLPVILAEHDALAPLLAGRVGDWLRSTPSDAWPASLTACPDPDWLSRVQLIPGRGVGGRTILLGFRPDSLHVHTAAGPVAAAAVVAIHSGRLAADGAYRALLHPAVLQTIPQKEGADICA